MRKYIFVLLWSMVLLSCAKRKIHIEKEDIKTEIDSAVTVKKDSVVSIQNGVTVKEDAEEVVIVPIDTAKPVIIDGKSYTNAVIKVKKSKKSTVDTTKTFIAKTEEKKTTVKKKERRKSKTKKVDATPVGFNWWPFIFLFVLAVLIKRYFPK